jgi:hypothetical protein
MKIHAVLILIICLLLAAPRAWHRADAAAIAPSDAQTVVAYPNCSAAHAAGIYSIREGEPGYRPELDADGDGLACEPYHGR